LEILDIIFGQIPRATSVAALLTGKV